VLIKLFGSAVGPDAMNTVCGQHAGELIDHGRLPQEPVGGEANGGSKELGAFAHGIERDQSAHGGAHDRGSLEVVLKFKTFHHKRENCVRNQ